MYINQNVANKTNTRYWNSNQLHYFAFTEQIKDVLATILPGMFMLEFYILDSLFSCGTC